MKIEKLHPIFRAVCKSTVKQSGRAASSGFDKPLVGVGVTLATDGKILVWCPGEFTGEHNGPPDWISEYTTNNTPLGVRLGLPDSDRNRHSGMRLHDSVALTNFYISLLRRHGVAAVNKTPRTHVYFKTRTFEGILQPCAFDPSDEIASIPAPPDKDADLAAWIKRNDKRLYDKNYGWKEAAKEFTKEKGYEVKASDVKWVHAHMEVSDVKHWQGKEKRPEVKGGVKAMTAQAWEDFSSALAKSDLNLDMPLDELAIEVVSKRKMKIGASYPTTDVIQTALPLAKRMRAQRQSA